jgi:Ca2+-binding RTX toxin-like protein
MYGVLIAEQTVGTTIELELTGGTTELELIGGTTDDELIGGTTDDELTGGTIELELLEKQIGPVITLDIGIGDTSVVGGTKEFDVIFVIELVDAENDSESG